MKVKKQTPTGYNFEPDYSKQLRQDYKTKLQETQKLLQIVERELSHAPEGSLQIKTSGGRTWYVHHPPNEAGREVYLNRSQAATIAALAQKKYDRRLKKVLEQNEKKLKTGSGLKLQDPALVYFDLPPVWKTLVEPHVLPDEEFIEEWYKKYRMIATGDDYKSKSEWLHDAIYQRLEIPFVYEPRLYLEGYGTVRPDYVALNVRTRKTYYHEHFGKMDDPEYCKKALAKLETYHRNGFYEGLNLIITMESSGHPMNPEECEAILRKYLL